MRTQEEILARIRKELPRDVLGFEVGEYCRALTKASFETLKGGLLKEGADISGWKPDLDSGDAIRKQCIDYMDFAWQKANGCRGISAGRSLAHYRAWLWLLGEDKFDDINEYQSYGKDHLRNICVFLDLDPDKWDDGRRVDTDSE